MIARENFHQMPDMSAVTGPAPIQEEEEEEDDTVEAEGVEDKDIELVMSQVSWNGSHISPYPSLRFR